MKAWLLGIASIFDFAGTLRDPRVDEILARSDADAIRSDWQAVGDDMWAAVERMRELHAQEPSAQESERAGVRARTSPSRDR